MSAPTSGRPFAHYVLLEKIGAGGMGEVYHARDSRLNRDVAVKLLPDEFAADRDRMARFSREAQVLASLNHPSIAAIYGHEEFNGTRALVMELVPGCTLAERLATGPIPVQESIELARQLAEALEYAHEKGIVHRDVKPANLKITPEGNIKVLDFGLAKALQGDPVVSVPENSPTLTMAATRAGVILGTAAYMSPEQARGVDVDKRADIWAFGVVLYEMLTGSQMFGGETVSDSLAAVLRSPIDLSKLPRETPPAVQRLLQRCLERDPKRRLRDIGDARLELDSKAALAEPHAPVLSAGRGKALPWAVSAVCLALAAGFATAWLRREPPPTPIVRFHLLPPAGHNFVGIPGVSPDGRFVAFVTSNVPGAARGQLWVRAVDSEDARKVDGASAATGMFWSPDSRYVGFPDRDTQQLKKVAISGGAPEVIAAVPGLGARATWSEDGTIVFAAAGSLFRVPAAGGEPKPLNLRGTWPHSLHGGNHFLYLTSEAAGWWQVMAGNLDGSEPKFVGKTESRVEYAAGHLVYHRKGVLMAQPFDSRRLETTGDPLRVAQSVEIVGRNGRADFSVSAKFLAYLPGVRPNRREHWFDHSGKALGALPAPNDQEQSHPDISPDGKRLAFDTSSGDPSAGGDIWVVDLDRGTSSRLTSGQAHEWVVAWSPDGRRVAFTSRDERGRYQIYVTDASNPGDPQPLLVNNQSKHHMDWSQDGKFLAYESGFEANSDVWVLPLEGDRKPYPVVATDFQEGMPQFSPDGSWLAYASNRTGRLEVYVQRFGQESKETIQISNAGGTSPRWRKDGRELCYGAADRYITCVPLGFEGSTLKPGKPIALFRTELIATALSAHFTMTADAQRFLVKHAGEGAQAQPLWVVLNWLDAASRQQ